MQLGLLHTGIRTDEKLLIGAAEQLGVDVSLVDVRQQPLHSDDQAWQDNDLYLERCLSTVRGTYVSEFLARNDIPVINPPDLAKICNSKFATTQTLLQHDVPTLNAYLAFNEATAKEAVEQLGGYPVVVKADNGSWGRLVSKVDSNASLETIIDHKLTLGGPQHGVFYIQEYLDKNGRDIRAFVFGGEVKAAIYRESNHWITNTSRGGTASNCKLTPEIQAICRQVGEALATPAAPNGGILGVDIFETRNGGLLINEVNHTTEFRNSETPTGVSISEEIIRYATNYVS